MAQDEITFEQAMKRLEEIVEQIETGTLTLEESLKVYEEGMKLSQLCTAKLDEAEGKVKQLVKGGSDFRLESGAL